MLEKDKKCIEFSMHSMIATHKPYQEDTEITITGMAPGKSLLFAINPFDIPCDVVVIPKRDFEKLQASVASHEKQDEEYLNFLKALFPDEDVEKLAWMTRQVCEPVVSHGAAQYWKDKCEQLQADLEFLKEMAKNREANYKLLLEKTGFTSVADLTAYICDLCPNPPEGCKTLKEIIKEWSSITCFSTPAKCDEYIKKLEDKLSRINKISEDD